MRTGIGAKWAWLAAGLSVWGCARAPEDGAAFGQSRAAMIEDAAHGNATNFTFLERVSKPTAAVAAELNLADPAYFAADADPVVQVWEMANASCDEARADCRLRKLADYSRAEPDEARRVVLETGTSGLLEIDGNTLTVQHSFFKVKLDVKKFHDELGLRLWPVFYRVEVLVPNQRGEMARVGFADVALAKIEDYVCAADGTRCKRITMQVKDLARELECAENHVPPEACANDYVVLENSFELPVRFWLNRCAGKDLAPDICHQPGVCDPLTGAVTFAPVPDDTVVCQGGKCDQTSYYAEVRCTAGACGEQQPVSCDDRNPCTADACAAQTGCAHENVDLGVLRCGVGVCAVVSARCVDGVEQTCVPGEPSRELCADGLDNDCDEALDCDDADCSADPACKSVVVPGGLIHWLPFDGDFEDKIGNADGVIQTNISGQPVKIANRHGTPDSAYYFNGASWVTLVAPMSHLQNRTLSLWVSPAQPTVTRYFLGTAISTQGMRYSNNTFLYLKNVQQTSWYRPVAANAWTHVVLVRGTTNPATRLDTFALYVNGQYVGTNNMDMRGGNLDFYLLGTRYDGYRWLGGIDDVRMYDRQLSPEEITALYNE